MNITPDQIQRQRFVRGVALAWAPFLFLFVFGLRNTFRGITSSKATGLEAVAGGLTEGFATFGFVAIVTVQVTAAVLLMRSFSKDYWGRSIVTVASLVWSGITLVVLAGFVLIRVYLRQ